MGQNASALDREQFEHFKFVERARFAWQMSNPLIAAREDHLVAALRDVSHRVLEIGSGEGANLVRLTDNRGGPSRLIGSDFSLPRLQFSRRVAPTVPVVVADAAHLPFATGGFDAVFCRDVLHHLPEVETAVAEFFRVTRPGGTVTFIEANGQNPVINVQARLLRAERGELRTSPEYFTRLMRAHSTHPLSLQMAEPLPLDRLACHYRFGFAKLGEWGASRRLLGALSDGAGKLIPRRRWSYAIITATK